MRQKVLWDILMKLFMSLNKSSIHPSLNYLSKTNAGLHFHRSAFRTGFTRGTVGKLNTLRNADMSIQQNVTLFIYSLFYEAINFYLP